MKKTLLAIAALSFATASALAQQSPWLVRARMVDIGFDVSNQTSVAGLSAKDKTIPEVDITYFFNPNVAAELILTVPQKHDVTVGGAAVGTFKHLPPTLTVQYHFTQIQGYKPYVGAGVNYTKIMGVHLEPAAAALGVGKVDLDNDSVGLALQAGVDIPIDQNWSFNVDIKRVNLKTRVYADGNSVGTLKLNPTLIGVGLGYRF